MNENTETWNCFDCGTPNKVARPQAEGFVTLPLHLVDALREGLVQAQRLRYGTLEHAARAVVDAATP